MFRCPHSDKASCFQDTWMHPKTKTAYRGRKPLSRGWWLWLCAWLWHVAPLAADEESAAGSTPPTSFPGSAEVSGILLTRAEALQVGEEFLAQFELDRAEVGGAYRLGWLGARLRMETIRSAGPNSFTGIDQNSLLPRIRFAYGEFSPLKGMFAARVRLGVVPQPWVESLEEIFDVRGLGPLASQQMGLFAPADLGLLADFSVWQGLVQLKLGLLNGEGHSQIELNPGKNAVAVLSLQSPAFELWGPWRFSVHGGVRDGSVGIASVRNHRAMLAFAVTHPWVDIGTEFAHAWGHQGRGAREAQTLGVWLRGNVFPPWLGYALRYERFDVDVALSDTERESYVAALYTELHAATHEQTVRQGRIRLYVGGESATAGTRVGPLPGVPDALTYLRFFVMMEVVGGISVLHF